ncbi:hypothetical protein PanWU01x14_019480 [Parasponia andersonii]|uniref:Uncharacterized protein n=1 Tax=Parasponia andersonii TaxID=3476 RepID=A0A2P5DYG7_PARAD|nr:hypothetical protein PanWU01x14_019480 [Parasponia andersonii]
MILTSPSLAIRLFCSLQTLCPQKKENGTNELVVEDQSRVDTVVTKSSGERMPRSRLELLPIKVDPSFSSSVMKILVYPDDSITCFFFMTII